MQGSEEWRRGVVRRRTELGAAALEFGLIMPILLLIVFGIVQYGFYFWAMQGGSDIARDAARRAAVGLPAPCFGTSADPGFVDVVEGEISDIAGTTEPVVTRTFEPHAIPDPTPDVVDINDTVRVTVTFKSIDLHIPLVPHIKDGVVSATAEARVEYVPDPDDLGNC